MNPKVIFSVCLVFTALSTCSGRAASNEQHGKYQVSKSTYDDGSYKPVKRNEGRYIHMVQPYVHVSDNRELGQYRHIPIPYNGGYGPYSGLLNPYHHDQSGNYDKYTTTTTTTRRPTTTTTTTVRPRLFNYHEEGGWRILRQEEEKRKHKYDFLYHTENGIYGQEKAHLRKGAGTAASGYYEYTGDDGELYRVNYRSDERGFIPEADHIPTPPPIPDAIKRALEYVAKKKEIHGTVQTGQYEHKPGPVKLQNMPTNDRPLSDVQPTAYPVKPIEPKPTVAPQPRFLQYDAANQYNPLPTGLGSVNAQAEQPQADQPQADQPQADQPQADQPQADQPQVAPPQYESTSVAPYETEEQLPADQQYEQAQLDQQAQPDPQQEQVPPEQLPQTEELPQPEQPLPQEQLEDQPINPAGYEVQEPQASEQINEFQPPYQVPEQLTDEDNFEYATA